MPIGAIHPDITELLEREAHHAKLEKIALRKKARASARFHNQVRGRILDKVARIRVQQGTMPWGQS